MDWVKTMVGYYRDLAVATGTDAAEVMFTRGNALAGELEQSGFIPDALLPSLSRRPAQAKKTADHLVKAGLWDRVRGGYLIVNFAKINDELERLVERKRRDRDRKRTERSARTSDDVSEDSPPTRPRDALYAESKTETKNAAAAARGANPKPLPATLDILRASLEAHKMTVRWDLLAADQVAEIADLIGIHGDGPLVKSALQQHQPNKPAATAQAWLPGWRQLRKPGDLAPVADPCAEPGHSGTTRHCIQCASEQKAATR